MSVGVPSSDSDLLDLLRVAGPLGVSDMADATEVTATAVRQRLTRLMAKGIIERDAIRAGRGRPKHLYRLTDKGLRLTGSNFADLALVLWHEINAIEDQQQRQQIIHRVARALAAKYSSQIRGETPTERMRSLGFEDLVVSIKAADVPLTVTANRAFAARSDLPLHLGITEAGMGRAAVVRGAVGLGVLLAEGIGDTIRVSMTDPPEEEAEVGVQILRSLGLRSGPRLISCPTCGRCRVDLRPIAARIAEVLREIQAPLTVAVMGCEVNGPGEAAQADIGLACGGVRGVIFARGERIETVPMDRAADALIEHMTRLAEQ